MSDTKYIELTICNNGWFDCRSPDCPYRYECANHITADSVRMEYGITPQIRQWPDGNFYCGQKITTQTDEECKFGMLGIKDNKFVTYEEYNNPYFKNPERFSY